MEGTSPSASYAILVFPIAFTLHRCKKTIADGTSELAPIQYWSFLVAFLQQQVAFLQGLAGRLFQDYLSVLLLRTFKN